MGERRVRSCLPDHPGDTDACSREPALASHPFRKSFDYSLSSAGPSEWSVCSRRDLPPGPSRNTCHRRCALEARQGPAGGHAEGVAPGTPPLQATRGQTTTRRLALPPAHSPSRLPGQQRFGRRPGRGHRQRFARQTEVRQICWIAPRSKIAASSFLGPPQCGQVNTSISNTRRISSAHECLARARRCWLGAAGRTAAWARPSPSGRHRARRRFLLQPLRAAALAGADSPPGRRHRAAAAAAPPDGDSRPRAGTRRRASRGHGAEQ